MSWNPETYLAFASHRERPIAELIGRIPPMEVARAVDLGCGTGNSTAALAQRFPDAHLSGIDNSAEMLAKARADIPDVDWQIADLATWQPTEKFDLILSSAALQWVPDHDGLFARLIAALNNGGALAVQMPRNFDAPSHQLLYETVENGPWSGKLTPHLRRDPVDVPEKYYERLASHMRHVDIWETTYIQALEGEDPVFKWTSGTALRPFLAALDGTERDDFCAAYRTRLAKAYPASPDGKTLFPFKRLFIVGAS